MDPLSGMGRFPNRRSALAQFGMGLGGLAFGTLNDLGAAGQASSSMGPGKKGDLFPRPPTRWPRRKPSFISS